jgi:thiol-disulfide isomerase/thioredoxin
VAADTLRNGRFMLCGEVEQLEMLSIAVQGEGFPSMGLNVWVEPDAVVSVSGRDKLLVTWKVKNRMPQQSDENRYIDASRSEYIQLQQALINYASLNILQRNKRDELLKQIDSLQMLIRGTEICMMQTTPYSEVWLTRFQKLAFWSKEAEGHPYRKELLALYELWPQPRKESPLGKFFQRKFFLPGMVWTGDEMADADLLDTLGRVHRLADYKGKYLLLDFWSIGCDPCRRAQPEMKRLGEVYRDVLTVIGITQDGEPSWKKYSAEQGIGGVNLRDPKRGAGLSGRYSVERIPHYVLISPEGKVITSWTGYVAGQLEKKLDELLPDSVGRPYLIEGKVQGVEDGTVVVMGRTTLRQATVVARDTIRNGTFRFSGLLNGPTHMVLRGDPRQGFSYTRLDFWAGPGTTVITGDDKMIRSWRVESTLPEQIEENRYAEACREAVHRQQVCRIERSRAGREKTPQTDSLWAEYMALQRLIDSAEIEMLQTLPNGVTPSPAWIDRFEMVAARANDKEYRHRDIVLALYDRLSDSVKRSAKGIGIAHSLFPAELLPGDVAPDGELVDPFGKMYRLADLRSPGKYMLLDFWASGCPPCRMSAPEMKEVAETYRDRLTVVAVNLDEVRAEWLKAAEKDGIVWTNLADPQGFDGLPYRYGVKGIPHYALLSPDGKLVASWAGYGPGYLKKNVAEAFAKADAASG